MSKGQRSKDQRPFTPDETEANMSETDFEAEARALVDSGDIEDIADSLKELAERHRTDGSADGFRRGVEAARKWADDNGWWKCADYMAEALLPPEPAKCTCVDRLDAFGTRNPNPDCPIHGARR